MERPIGILLSNLGTPEAPTTAAVRRYLRQFLTDPRVIDIPWLPRQLLVNCVIAPFRAPHSARAYASIWSPEGSPLMVHSCALGAEVANRLGPDYRVALGMRYGNPSIENAFGWLASEGCREIRLVPLYPHEAEATTGSTRAEFERVAHRIAPDLPFSIAPPFPELPGFVEAQTALARDILAKSPSENRHVLLSYHGLPERHVLRGDPSGVHCLVGSNCCDSLSDRNRHCYRAQCHATSRALARALDIAPGEWSTSFQSRLGRIPWIGPHTDAVVRELAEKGVRNLVVLTPSFVAECLETLEEIGQGQRRQFLSLGGESFALVPCVNRHPLWVDAVVGMARRG